MIDRELLTRYLRQLAELGVEEIVLDHLSAEQALALLTGSPAAAGGARAAAPAGAPPVRESAVPGTRPGLTARALAAAAGIESPEMARAESAATSAPAADPSGTATAAPAARPTAPAPRVTSGGAPTDSALKVLEAASASCTRCGLHSGRSSVVFGEGDPAADVVVVGEAPGQEEDRTGRPFVGRAGRLLDLLLMTAGFPREKVYICNVLKCRPPNNRNPLPDEVTACTTSFLHGQLEAIAPRVLIAVGKFAAQALLQSEESIGRLRGAVHSYRGTPLIVTYHPAYLLRSPQMTRVAWQDFQLLRKVLDEQTRG